MTTKQKNIIIERGVRITDGSKSGGDFAKQAVQVIRDLNDKRENEKHELQVLNTRFSSYVERVRALEAMNRKLLADIEELKSKWGLDSGRVKEQMEPELLKFREQIDEITRQKAVAEIKSKRAESDAAHYRHMLDLAIDSANADKLKIQNLERILDNTRQDAEYLKSQFGDVHAQIEKYLEEQRRYLDQLRLLKDDLDRETIERVARQNEVQTLEEQIAFIKAVHEQELSELSRLQTIVGFDPTQFYRNELERAVRDIRGDFEQLNHEQKRELEEWYKIKTEEVEREVQKERERERIQTTGISVEEATTLRTTHQDSAREYVELQHRHNELLTRLRELEEKYEHCKAENSIGLSERERELQLLHEKISELMHTYDELLGRKTSLEFEINTYRRLLECEETRITSGVSGGGHGGSHGHGSSSSSSYRYESKSGGGGGGSGSGFSVVSGGGSGGGYSTGTYTVGNSARPVDVLVQRGGRSGSADQSAETIMKRMQVQRTSKGPVGIKEISPDGKFVLLENTGRRGDVDISKWQIRRKVDDDIETVYTVPSGTVIGSGRNIRIWSRGQGRASPPNDLVHDYEWKSGESMVTRLLSDNGEERALYSQRATA